MMRLVEVNGGLFMLTWNSSIDPASGCSGGKIS